MATKKKATRKTTTKVEEPIDLEDELDAFDRAKRDFAGAPGVRLTVYRYDDGETAYLKRIAYDPATVDEEWIRKKWGPGTYQLRFTDEDGSRVWSKVVQIASDVSPDAPRGGPGANGDALFIATIQKQNEIMLQAVLQGLRAPGAPPGDQAALVALIQAQAAQTTAILSSALNRPDISTTLLSVLERGMAIASEHQADAEGGWLAQVARIAKDVLPSMAEMARARAMPGPMPPGTMPVAGAGASSPPALPAGAPPKANGAPASPPAPAGPLLDVDELTRSYAPAILDAIGKGTAPEEVADVILGYLPPAVYDELEALTTERAIRAAPALSQHRPYVEQLVASLREAIREDSEPQP